MFRLTFDKIHTYIYNVHVSVQATAAVCTQECIYIHNYRVVITFNSCFYWISIRAFRGSSPPVNYVILEKLLCMMKSVLRIVILHKSMTGRVHIMNERNQVRF